MIKQVVNIFVALLVLYNVLQAFKASKAEKRLYRRYNKYFMVLAIFLTLDNLFSLFLNLIPFYQFFKLIVVAWMSVPTCTGAVFIHKFYINGLMLKYESKLDETIERIKNDISGYFNQCYEKAQKKCRDHGGSRGSEVLGIRGESNVSSKMISHEDSCIEGSDSGFSTIDASEEDKPTSAVSSWASPTKKQEEESM